ncbi:hypothetical protein [Povalibacter sp.]|uniref:hypothetical protein n=1 Tax=Povalibacter sp. TaxID=1962978 RepID=UPI002F42150C
MNRSQRLLQRPLVSLILGALALPLLTGAAPTNGPAADDWKPPGGRIGYVLWDEYWGIRETADAKEECPQGFNIGPREQFAILYPQNGKPHKLVDSQLAYEADVWFPTTKPDRFEFHEATGKYALGIDLDGKNSPEDFVSDDGRTGIDNELFRVVGCVRNYRKEGELGIITTKWRQQNPFNRVTFELTNVDSLKNDPEVTVSYYRTSDHLLSGTTGNFLPGGSQRIDGRWGKRFTATTRGRIVDGVLETDPFDLELPEWALSDPSIIKFKGTKLRLALTPERAEGVLGGYADVEQWYYAMNTSWATHHAAYGQASAPSIYRALRRRADGYPDPKTGENTAISAVMDIKLAQVYVIHPDQAADRPTDMPARGATN